MSVPIKPVKGDLIQSQVLPGFQFRIEDLFNQPSVEQMGLDPVYHKFVVPQLKAEQMARQKPERLLDQERGQRGAASRKRSAKSARSPGKSSSPIRISHNPENEFNTDRVTGKT